MSRKHRNLTLIIIIALGAAVIAGWQMNRGRKGDSSPPTSSIYENARVFETWDEYLSLRDKGAGDFPRRRKVIFIGLDGATWNIIDPMLKEGLLPTFRKLEREGTYAVLRSLEIFVSPPAWVSMMTGILPHKSGVYTFGKWDEENQKFHSISSEDVMVPSVWDIASIAGMKVAVTNIPITYPAQKVNGIMVAGELAPITLVKANKWYGGQFETYKGDFLANLGAKSYSPPLIGAVEIYGNSVTVLLYDSTNDGRQNYDAGVFVVLTKRQVQSKSNKAFYYFFNPNVYSPWIQIDFEKDGKVKDAWCQFMLIGRKFPLFSIRVSPVLKAVDDPDLLNTYPPEFNKVIRNEFGYYFPYPPYFDKEQTPAFTKEEVKYTNYFYNYDDWDLFMHAFLEPDKNQHREGFSRKTRQVYEILDQYLSDLLLRLPKDALLIIASDHGFKEYKYTIDLNSYLASLGLLEWHRTDKNEKEIEYDKSLVHYNMYCLYFNHKLLSRRELLKRGIPIGEGENPKEALTNYLKEKGRELKDPKTGRSMPVEFIALPESTVGMAPDLIVTGGYTDYKVEFWDYYTAHKDIVSIPDDRKKWDHKRDGILFVYGEGVKKGYDAGVKDVQDIAPTILYALGLPLSESMDGKVMEDIFEAYVKNESALLVVKKYEDVSKNSKIPDEEREALEKKLKSLGYIR